MNYVGIDIGSSASKVVVRGEKAQQFVMPTGWSGRGDGRGDSGSPGRRWD